MNEEVKKSTGSNNKFLTILVVILLILAVVQSVCMFSVYCSQCSKQDIASGEFNNPPPPIFAPPSVPPTAVPLKPLPQLKSITPGGQQGANYRMIDPFQEMQKMQEEMDRAFDAALNRFRSSPGFNSGDRNLFFEPQMNIMDNGDKYIIKLDMPGLTKDDVSVELKNHLLTIFGKSSQEIRQQDDQMLLTERRSGQFNRSVMLPGDVDDSKLKADCKRGSDHHYPKGCGISKNP